MVPLFVHDPAITRGTVPVGPVRPSGLVSELKNPGNLRDFFIAGTCMDGCCALKRDAGSGPDQEECDYWRTGFCTGYAAYSERRIQKVRSPTLSDFRDYDPVILTEPPLPGGSVPVLFPTQSRTRLWGFSSAPGHESPSPVRYPARPPQEHPAVLLYCAFNTG